MRKGWTYKKLGEVCKTSSGGTPSKSHKEYYEGGSIPWLRSGEVAQGLIYDTELCITELGLEKSSAKIFPIDTVVIAMYGATVGQVGILKCEMSTNQAVCGIFPNSKLYPLFLLYCLKSKKSLFLKDAVGGAQPNISQNLIKNTVIPIPPLAEQGRIVAELDLLSSIIDKKKAQLKAYDQLAQSIFYDMFGDPITNEKGWEVKKLGEVCYIGLGFTHTPTYVEKGIPFLSVKDISSGIIDFSEIKFVSEEEYLNAPKGAKPNKGDILFCRVGTMGKPVIINTDMQFCTFVSLGYLRILFNQLNNVYVKYWMLSDSFNNQVTANVKGLAIKNLNTGWLKMFDIPLPPLSLQQSFAEKIEAIEHQKALIQQSIDETQTLFDSRMDYWFG